MKVFMLTEIDDKEVYVETHIEKRAIHAYYMTDENFVDDSINIITFGTILTLKQDSELLNFLTDKFR